MSSELWLGYVAGALTFGWLLPWIERKKKENLEVNNMKMNQVSAPVMGTYEVQNCPNCGSVPCVDVTVKRKETVDSILYSLSEEVYCTCCGLSGTSVELWNKLRCSE